MAQPKQNELIQLPEVVVTPEEKTNNMAQGLTAGGQGFLSPTQADQHTEILPTDQASAGRINEFAGIPPNLKTPTWDPQPNSKMPEPVAGNPSQAMRNNYATALDAGEIHGPQDFAERFMGQTWSTARAAAHPEEDTPDAQATTSAWMTNAAKGLARGLPTNEALTDYGIQIAKEAGLADPANAATARKNLLDHWKETGENPADVANRASWDLNTRFAMLAEHAAEQKHTHDEAGLWKGVTLTQEEFEAKLPENLKTPGADKIEPTALPIPSDIIAEGLMNYKDIKSFATKTGLELAELWAGGVVAGYVLKQGTKVVARVWTKIRSVDPAAAPGEGVKMLSPEKAHEFDPELHAQALDEAKHPGALDKKPPLPEGAPEPKYTPEEIKELADGYKTSWNLIGWFNELMKDESGALHLFSTPVQKLEKARKQAGRVSAMVALTRKSGLETQQIRQFTAEVEKYRREINKHMEEWEGEIAKGQAGRPMDTMIGNLISYMQGRSSGAVLRSDSPFGPTADALREINRIMEKRLRDYDKRGLIDMKSFKEDYFKQQWENPFEVDKVFPTAKQGSTGFMKERKYMSWEEGLNAGLKPKILDPIELTLADTHAKLRFLTAIDAREELIRSGHAYWGFKPNNPGDAVLNGHIAERQILRPMQQRPTPPGAQAGQAMPGVPQIVRNPGGGYDVHTNGPAGVLYAPNQTQANALAKQYRTAPPGKGVNPVKDVMVLQTQRLYATPGATRIWNNAFSNGMFSHPGGATLYDKAMWMTNTTSMIKLIDPMFHVQVIGQAAVASGIAQTLEEVGRGQFLRAIGSIMQLPVRPLVNAYIGGKYKEIYSNRLLHDPNVQRLIEGGLNIGRAPTFNMGGDAAGHAVPTIWQSLARGSLLRELDKSAMQVFGKEGEALIPRIVKGAIVRYPAFVARELGRLAQSITHPIFGEIIPNMKLGAALQREWSYLAANRTASEAAITTKVMQVVKDVENRMGELNMETIFWPKFAKQAIGLALISTSWVYGTYRGIFAAMGLDIENVRGWAKWNTTAFTSLIGTVVSLAMMNSIKQYFHDGRMPWQTPTPVTDMIAYRTGMKNPDGSPERIVSPSEMKELYDQANIIAYGIGDPTGLGPPITNYVLGKFNAAWQVDLALARNQDSIGNIISQRPGGLRRFLLEAAEPIFVSQFENERKGTGLGPLMTFMGDRRAPEFIQNWDLDQKKKAGWRAKQQLEAIKRDARENALKAHPRDWGKGGVETTHEPRRK